MFNGERIDRIIGLENVTVETVMAGAPDGSDVFEIVRFHSPSAGAQEPAPAANSHGLRHIAFSVDDVRGVVERVREAGWDTVGEIVDFQNTFHEYLIKLEQPGKNGRIAGVEFTAIGEPLALLSVPEDVTAWRPWIRCPRARSAGRRVPWPGAAAPFACQRQCRSSSQRNR